MMSNPAFLLSYALLWVLTVVQSLVILKLMRTRPRPMAAAAVVPAPAPGLRVGGTAPTFSATRAASGEAFGLEDLRGSRLLLVIAAAGCRNCTDILPALRETARRTARRLVIVCVGPSGGCDEYAAGTSPETLLVSDPGGRSVRAFGTSAIPQVVAIDSAGRITAAGGTPSADGTWAFAETANGGADGQQARGPGAAAPDHGPLDPVGARLGRDTAGPGPSGPDRAARDAAVRAGRTEGN
jgi:AhpC/TSA family